MVKISANISCRKIPKNLMAAFFKSFSSKKKKKIEILSSSVDKIKGGTRSKHSHTNPAKDCLFWSWSSCAILKKKLCEKYLEHKFIANELVKQAVEETRTELSGRKASAEKSKETAKEVSMQPSFFCCKCGWLLCNVVTLPCGHTFCKECVEETMLCLNLDCGYVLEAPCVPSTFLEEIISSWFSKEHQATKLKKEANKYRAKKKFKKALSYVNKSLDLCGNDYTSLILRSEVYTKLRRHKDALRDAESACILNTNDGKAQFQRGICFANIGDLNTAIDAFQQCLELSPDDVTLSNAVVENIDKILSPSELLVNDNAVDATSIDDSDVESGNEETDVDNHNQHVENLSNNIPSSSKKDDSPNPLKVEEKPKNIKEICSTLVLNGDSIDKAKDSSNYFVDEIPQCSHHVETEATGKSVELREKIHGVPVDLLKEDDMECRLCYELLYKPVTTPCGHVFCKNCLLRTLDHSPNCPICRISLQNYLSNQSKPVTELIEKIIKTYFEKQFNERDIAYKERLEELSRVGIDENVEIPVFVCSIAFPYVKCPLHIFEPKYRLMIRECLESGSRKFGMCMPKSGPNSDGEYADIGAIVEILSVQLLPDGRYIVDTIAGQRFIVRNKSTRDTLDYAKVTYFCDEPEDLNMEEFSMTSRQIFNQLATYINMLKSAEKDCIFNALGMLPAYEHDHTRFQHGVPWLWWGLAALPLNLTAKLVLLRSKCVSERMISLQRFLRFLINLNPTAAASNNA